MEMKRFDRILKGRIWGSAIAFALFVGTALHGVITGWHFEQPTPVVALLLISFLAWPRRAWPRNWQSEGASTASRQEVKGRRILQTKLNRVRLFYFGAAVVLLVGLPYLLGEPVLTG